MRLNRLLAGGSIAALLSGVAACGLQSVEPKIQLRDALRAFGDQSSGALRLSVPSSEDDIRAFIAAADEAGEGEDVPDDVLSTLLSSSMVVGFDEGKDAEDPADDGGRFVVEIGDLDAVEVRTTGETLYARADVDGLADEFPDLGPDLESFRAELDAAEAGAADLPAALLAPARALLEGEWMSLDGAALVAKVEEMSGTAATVEEDAKLQSDLQELGGKALQDAVVGVERKGEDDDLGDHLVVKLNLRKGYATVRDELPGILPTGEDPAALEEQLPPVDEVPDQDVAVSVWVNDGELTRAELDAAQFLEKPAGHLVLRADVLDAEPVTAPSDSVEVDVNALFDEAMAAGDAPFAGGEVLDAYTLATWVDMDLATVAAEQGGEPSVAFLPEILPWYEGATPDLVITAVGPRVQVATGGETVCLTPSPDGMAEVIDVGPC
ncbi:hypothetical protein [Blastococcus sp. LR1]|uniref:hypothetical protein n=1 Tax=Blastococcus sp. LR1 TaxID=2877000 RepID=UPI001CCC3F1C|nr:hypothetical protein [Blastococcus sp. LR1]MCA0145184.1 hypothetical protein [Blastococcus sp. LR1]